MSMNELKAQTPGTPQNQTSMMSPTMGFGNMGESRNLFSILWPSFRPIRSLVVRFCVLQWFYLFAFKNLRYDGCFRHDGPSAPNDAPNGPDAPSNDSNSPTNGPGTPANGSNESNDGPNEFNGPGTTNPGEKE